MANSLTDDYIQKIVDDYKEKSRLCSFSRSDEDEKQLKTRLVVLRKITPLVVSCVILLQFYALYAVVAQKRGHTSLHITLQWSVSCHHYPLLNVILCFIQDLCEQECQYGEN